MNALICLISAAMVSQQGPHTRVQGFEGIPKASKQIVLKGKDLDALPGPALRFNAIPASMSMNADLRAQARRLVGPIRNQLQRPTGTVHAVTFLAEFRNALALNRNGLDLSEEFLNTAANYICGNLQDGDHMGNCFQAYARVGICTEASLPYAPRYDRQLLVTSEMRSQALTFHRGVTVVFKTFGQGETPPINLSGSPVWPVTSGQGLNEVQLRAIQIELDRGNPVAVAVRWPSAHLSSQVIAGVAVLRVPLPEDAPGSMGLPLLGYKIDSRFPGGGFFLFRGSFGPQWGDSGYGYLSFNYVRNLALGVYVLK